MQLYIKNMVSIRCAILVRDELLRLKIPYHKVELGRVELEIISTEQREQLQLGLLAYGLELHQDKKSLLVERIKKTIELMIRNSENGLKMNYSLQLSQALNHDYTYLANIFSQVENISIQQYIIFHKIERVKELIQHKELTLSEISFKMHYSSAAHLSNQFKKVTGISPSSYRSQQLGNEVIQATSHLIPPQDNKDSGKITSESNPS